LVHLKKKAVEELLESVPRDHLSPIVKVKVDELKGHFGDRYGQVDEEPLFEALTFLFAYGRHHERGRR